MTVFIQNLLIGPTLYGLIFTTLLLLAGEPSKRNFLYGYRTARAMKSEAAFQFANRLFFRYFRIYSYALLVIGLLMALLSNLVLLNVVAGVFCCFAGLAYIILKVESALKQRFPQTRTK